MKSYTCKCIAPSAHKWCTIVCTLHRECGGSQGGLHTHREVHRGVHRECTVHRGETMTERVRGSSAVMLYYYSAS